MINIRSLVLSSILFWCIISQSHAQIEKLKAAYLYNFAAMTNYPAAHQGGNFTIAVLGSSSILPELEAIAKTKKIGSQTIEVKKISSISELSYAQMVFIPDDSKSKIPEIISKTSSAPTVIVTESDGASVKGSIFNFVLVDQKLRFEVNEQKANSIGIKLAANLIKLGIPVK